MPSSPHTREEDAHRGSVPDLLPLCEFYVSVVEGLPHALAGLTMPNDIDVRRLHEKDSGGPMFEILFNPDGRLTGEGETRLEVGPANDGPPELVEAAIERLDAFRRAWRKANGLPESTLDSEGSGDPRREFPPGW